MLPDDVLPLCLVQSKLSSVAWVQPQVLLSKLQLNVPGNEVAVTVLVFGTGVEAGVVAPGGVALEGVNTQLLLVNERSSSAMSPW